MRLGSSRSDRAVHETKPVGPDAGDVVELNEFTPGGSSRWAPDINEVLRDVGGYCWVGDSWTLVWFVRDYACTGRLQLVLTEADNQVQEGPVPAVSADVRVPADPPPGWHRAVEGLPAWRRFRGDFVGRC